MPKHVPSFKHLVAQSSSSSRTEKRERSVNELIASSRSSGGSRDVPPHLTALATGQRVWVPSAEDNASGITEANLVHPAEILRRAQVARNAARRGVAGPAPPPSWQSSPADPSSSKGLRDTQDVVDTKAIATVTTGDLVHAGSLFALRADTASTTQRRGAAKLVEYCLHAVLRHLNDPTVLPLEPDGLGLEAGPMGIPQADAMTIGEALREQVTYLEPHLKIVLLDIASLLPEASPARLSDRSLRAILARPTSEEAHDTPVRADNDDFWSETSPEPPDIHHLALTLHLHPITLLRQIPIFPAVSLTSLNLAYSTIRDLERLVAELPTSLRELGLAGIRMPASAGGNVGMADIWRRGLSALGRKMIVLRMLDLSFAPVPITPILLLGLLKPPATRLPSLTRLGLRDVKIPDASGCREFVDSPDPDLVCECGQQGILAVVRSVERKKWVDVEW